MIQSTLQLWGKRGDDVEKTVVITGASSGIGRTTAMYLARKGMNVVLVSRSENELEEVAQRCRQSGIRALVQQADVTNFEDVQHVAQAAQAAFGTIDAWVNNAGVTEVGRFTELDRDEFKRVMDINFFGVVNGSRAALNLFMEQGYGIVINVSSVAGVVPDPYESPYVASKFAVRGFSGALRQELYADGFNAIRVCTVMPATMNTPIYNNAANKSGREAGSIPPAYPAEMVSETIEALVYEPRDEVYVGGLGWALACMYKIAPRMTERLFARYVHKVRFKRGQTTNTKGNLFRPSTYAGKTAGQFTLPKYADKLMAGSAILLLGLVAYKIARAKKRRHD